jgi:hypothetical protein
MKHLKTQLELDLVLSTIYENLSAVRVYLVVWEFFLTRIHSENLQINLVV